MVLSARCYLLAAAAALLGILGQWSERVPPDLWRVVAGGVLLVLLAEGLAARLAGPALGRRLPARAWLGRAFPARLEIENPQPRPLAGESIEDYPATLLGPAAPARWSAPARGRETLHASLVPRALGPLEWERVHVRVRGRFGLAGWRRVHRIPARVEVTPDHLHAERPRAGTAGLGRHLRAAPGAGTELLGLRDYRPGDSLRIVDWKATARRGQPIVRSYGAEEHMELVLGVDAGHTSALESGTLTRLHHYVNVASRLAEQALRHGDHVSVVVFADAPLRLEAGARGLDGLRRVREALGAARTVPRESNPLAATLRIRGLVRQRALVVLFSDLEEGEAADQLLRSVALLTPKHFPVVASLLDEEILARRWAPARRWTDPYANLAALELTRAMHATAKRLERLGARVVLDRPADLDRRLLACHEVARQRRRV